MRRWLSGYIRYGTGMTLFGPTRRIPAASVNLKQYLTARSVPVAYSLEENARDCIAFIGPHETSVGVMFFVGGYSQDLEYVRFPGVRLPKIW